MSNHPQEIEAKFYLRHLDKMRSRVKELRADLIQPRILETNLRFDLPDGSLSAQGQVLRLRHDTEAKLTYKGAGRHRQGVQGRDEIEFVVDDFEKARQFLEALGYRQTMVYEKYRATYELEGVHIMLDELPYGTFIEIEGENDQKVHSVADKLNLDRQAAIDTSYTGLFENVRNALNLSFVDLTFENFKNIPVGTDHLQVRAADEAAGM